MNDISNNILSRVSAFMAENRLLPDKDSLIFIGLSGGSDSVALLHILLALDYKHIIATHCNFQLRGEESERDEQFVVELCRKLKIKLKKRRFNTLAYMDKHHLSLEMACRELRYDWWQELIGDEGYYQDPDNRFIAVGHHLDDSIETLLMNLMRGTGINGLTGIVPFNQATRVVRPLLSITRRDILDYVSDNNLDFVTDSTNRENDCQRNSIRNRLLPLMEEINPNARKGITTTMQHLQDAQSIVYQHIDQKFAEHVKRIFRNGREIQALRTKDMDVHRNDFPSLVREFIISHNIKLHPNTLQQIVEAAITGERKIFQGENYWINNSEEQLLAEQQPLDFSREEFEIRGTEFYPSTRLLDEFNVFETTPQQLESLKVDASMTLIDADKVKLPLIMRHWREGDRILPFGRTQSKLVSDLMTDAHFSWWQKATNWLVTDARGTILWVYGLRSADNAKIDKTTKKVYAIIGPDLQ